MRRWMACALAAFALGCYEPELEEVVIDRRSPSVDAPDAGADVGAPDLGAPDAGEGSSSVKCEGDPCTFWALGTSGVLYRVDPYSDRAIQSLRAENYLPDHADSEPLADLSDVVVSGSRIYLLSGADILEISLTQRHVARRFEGVQGRTAPHKLAGGHGGVYVQTGEGQVVALETAGEELAYGNVLLTGTPTNARDFAVAPAGDIAWFLTPPTEGDAGDTLVSVERDGTRTELGPTRVIAITGLAITSGAHLWAVTSGGLVLHLDTKTGEPASRYLLLDHDGFASASSEVSE